MAGVIDGRGEADPESTEKEEQQERQRVKPESTVSQKLKEKL